MTAKPRGPGDSGDGDGPGGNGSGRHRGGSGGGAENVARAQDIVDAEMKLGRPAEGGSSRPSSDQTDDGVTRPTGQPGGLPEGSPTRIDPKQDDDVQRSLTRENTAAQLLAAAGHHTQQNPSPAEVAAARAASGDTGDPTKNPDYLVDGRVFDCYSPGETKPVRGVWSEVEEKIVNEQTQRVVVNLEDWGGDLPDLRKQFDDWPIENLKEVKAILPDGQIVQIHP